MSILFKILNLYRAGEGAFGVIMIFLVMEYLKLLLKAVYQVFPGFKSLLVLYI